MTLLALLLPALLPLASLTAQSPAAVPLFTPEYGGVVEFREPALVRTPGGTLIAVAEAHQDAATEAPWRVELALRTSIDDGRTWSDLRMLREFDHEAAATRPSLLVDPTTGRVFLFHNYAAFGVDWDSSAPGTNAVVDVFTLHVQVMHSDDEGATWSEPRDLNKLIKQPEWEAIAVSSASGIATSTGRLIQPVFVRTANTGIGARNISSEDGGATWHMGPRVGEETAESCVIELADGSLLQNMTPVAMKIPRTIRMRRPDALKWRLLAHSEDGVNFGELIHEKRLPDSNFDGTLVRRGPVEGDPRDLVVFANAHILAGRERLSLRWSEDGCGTWAGKRLIDAGPSGACALAFLEDNLLGVLFERGDERFNEQVAFVRLDLDLLGGAPSLLDSTGAPNADAPELWAWYEAHGTEVTGAKGQRVARLADRGTAGRHDLGRVSLGTGSLLPAALGEHDVLRFGGPLTPPEASGSGSQFGTLAGPLTIAIVMRVGNVRGPNVVLDGIGSSRLTLRSDPGIGGAARPRWSLHLRTGELDLAVPTGEVTAREFAVHTIVLRRKTIHHFIGGKLAGTAELPDSLAEFGLDGLQLGTDGNARTAASCDIAELLVYRMALAGPERKALETYLALKYGL